MREFEVTEDSLAPMTGTAIFCPAADAACEDCPRYIALSDLVGGTTCETCGTQMTLKVVHDADQAADVAGAD